MSDALIAGRQASAHRMIQRWGGVGYLVRSGVQRVATMARMEYTPRERGLYGDKASKIRISTIGLATAPDHELDTIIYKGEEYNIILPVEGPRVTGVFVFYDCPAMFTQNYVAPVPAQATGTLQMPTNPSDGQIVTIGSRVYTFQTTLTNVDGNVHIGGDASVSLFNLQAALRPPFNGGGPGLDYALSTTEHPDVERVAFPVGTTLDVRAKVAGTAGNSIVTTTNVTGASWSNPTLTGGA
jgi:hypothetical protein